MDADLYQAMVDKTRKWAKQYEKTLPRGPMPPPTKKMQDRRTKRRRQRGQAKRQVIKEES